MLNLFAGPMRLNGCIEAANDIDPTIPCTLFQMDALECAKMFREKGELFDAVLLDPLIHVPAAHNNRVRIFKTFIF